MLQSTERVKDNIEWRVLPREVLSKDIVDSRERVKKSLWLLLWLSGWSDNKNIH